MTTIQQSAQPMRRLVPIVAASLAAVVLAGCAATATTNTPKSDPTAATITADRRAKLDAAATESLNKLYSTVPGSREMVARSAGVLVFPGTIAGGFVIGAEYGEGVMRNRTGRTQGYYRLASGSIGFTIGAQSKDVYFIFQNAAAYERFLAGDGWTAGGDASVAMAVAGANGVVDFNAFKQDVVALVITNAGLMANLSVEGSKVTRLR